MYDNKSRLCITPCFSLHSKVDNFVTKVFDLTFIQSEGELAARLVDGEFLTESSQNISFSPQNKSNKIFWEWQKQPRTRSSLTQAGEVATTNLPPGRPGARNMEILSGYENCNEAAADLGSAAGHNCKISPSTALLNITSGQTYRHSPSPDATRYSNSFAMWW